MLARRSHAPLALASLPLRASDTPRDYTSRVPLVVLWERAGVLAIDKPAGLPSTGRTLDDPRCAQHELASQLGVRVWALHQLDAETSGVLLFARRRSLVASWQDRLKPPSATKRYLAITHGAPSDQIVRAPLGYDESARRWRVASGGKNAESALRVLASTGEHALVEVELRTGRTHQARVHLAHVGCPIVGDKRYCDIATPSHPRHALHAHSLELALPDGTLRIVAPLPEDLRALARALGLGDIHNVDG